LGTPAALVDGITHGWARLLTTVPPVGTADHLGAIVYLCAFVACFASVTLARRTRLTLLPGLPALAVLVAAILVGTDRIASLLLQGVVLGAGLLIWASHRGHRRRRTLHLAGSSRTHERLTAAAFLSVIAAGTLLLGPVLPFASHQDRYVLRRHTEPPFDPRAYPSPLSQYKHWRDLADPVHGKADKRPVLTVTGLPKGVPLQLASLDLYDGKVWLVGSDLVDDDPTGSGRFERVGSDLLSGQARLPGQARPVTGAPGENIRVTVVDDRYEGPWLPVTAGVRSVRFTGRGAKGLARALRFNVATGTAAVTTGIQPGDRLTFDARVPAVAHAHGTERDKLVADRGIDESVSLPSIEDPTSSLAGKATSLAGSSSGPSSSSGAYAKLVAMERALTSPRSSYFSDGVNESGQTFTAGHTASKLQLFLSQTAGNRPVFIGNAEKFAAAMAAMARTMGLPARVVVGFRDDANDKDPAKRTGDTVTFIADHYDAWVEVAFDKVGWVPFFPTPPRKNGKPPPPKSTEPEVKQAELQARPPVQPPPNVSDLTPQRHKGSKKPSTTGSGSAFHLPAWLLTAAEIVGLPLLAVVALSASVVGFKRWRRKRRRLGGEPVDRVAGAWREMVDQLRDAGTAVPTTGTRLEMASAIPADRWSEGTSFAERVNAAMFGPHDPDPEVAESVWRRVDDLRAHLATDLGFPKRLARELNPSSLRSWR
jgi:hypothetical protein